MRLRLALILLLAGGCVTTQVGKPQEPPPAGWDYPASVIEIHGCDGTVCTEVESLKAYSDLGLTEIVRAQKIWTPSYIYMEGNENLAGFTAGLELGPNDVKRLLFAYDLDHGILYRVANTTAVVTPRAIELSDRAFGVTTEQWRDHIENPINRIMTWDSAGQHFIGKYNITAALLYAFQAPWLIATNSINFRDYKLFAVNIDTNQTWDLGFDKYFEMIMVFRETPAGHWIYYAGENIGGFRFNLDTGERQPIPGHAKTSIQLLPWGPNVRVTGYDDDKHFVDEILDVNTDTTTLPPEFGEGLVCTQQEYRHPWVSGLCQDIDDQTQPFLCVGYNLLTHQEVRYGNHNVQVSDCDTDGRHLILRTVLRPDPNGPITNTAVATALLPT